MKKVKNLLVVDDDQVSSYLSSLTIEDMGIAEKVATADNGKQALEFLEKYCFNEQGQAEEFCPELILLDLNMPIMDGFEFLEEMQTKYADWITRIPICILTSSSAGKDKLKASHYPISGYITKPLTEDNLTSILGKI